MSHPPLDPATVESLLESVGGDREFLAELFTAFADEAPGLMANIETGAANGDFTALHRAAHTMKSTAASLGALQLSEVCRELEASGRSGIAPEASSIAHARELLGLVLLAMSEAAQGEVDP
jgi:histidine phosphotransfer protein HptB